MDLDGATFLVQWAAGGMVFCWVTTRRREVSLGYGWLLRGVFGAFATWGLVLWVRDQADQSPPAAAQVAALLCVVACLGGIATSVQRRRAGVSEGRAERARKAARVAAMLPADEAGAADTGAPEAAPAEVGPEFDPRWDLAAGVAGMAALVLAATTIDAPYWLSTARLLSGAAFLGCVSDAMLLGHWYLTQPGLRRDPLKELVRWLAWLWPVEVGLFLIPEGMVQVFTGAIDDGWDGLLGWIWVVSAITTIVLTGVTWAALKERYYSAVMAATGLLYLAILTAFGTDLVARAVLAP